jgi:CHAT domain-containing protein
LGEASLPSFAHIVAENSIVESVSDAEKLVDLGRNLYSVQRYAEAATVLQQAIADFKAKGDGLQGAIAQSNLSLVYQQLGQWDLAENAIAQSLNLLQTSGNTSTAQSQILAQALDVRGRLYLLRGQGENALNTWRQASNIYARLGDETGVIRNRINQAQALQALGLYHQAQNALTQGNQSLQKQPDSPLKAKGLRSLGNVFRVIGDLKQSQEILEQSLAVAKRSPSPQDISAALLSLGNTARARADIPTALTLYQQASEAAVSASERIQAQLNQLSLLVEMQRSSGAGENSPSPITNYQLPIPNIEANLNNLPPSRATVYARINLAQSLIRLKEQNYTNARSESEIAQVLVAAIQQAKSLQDKQATSYALGILGELYEVAQQRSNAQEVTQQALFIAQTIDAKDIAYRWQWQMGRLLKQEGNIKGAIAAYTEAVNNLKSIRRELSAVNPDVQFNFRDEVEPVYRQLVDLLLQSEPSQENLVQARNLIESLQLAELENFFRASCLDANPELIDRIVDREDKTAAVIYPIILGDRLEVILKLPTQAKLRHYVSYKSQNEIETTLEQLRQSLLDVTQTSQVKRQSQQVYELLILPIESELANSKIKNLVFVLDGSLRNIPMAVLYDKQQEKYLVEKYAIALAPGLQLIQPKPLQKQQLRALTGGVAEGREIEDRKFPPLGNVRLELERIQSEVSNSEQLLNQTFTITNLQNQLNSNNFSVVHIATHGEFSSNPEATFILTWNQLLKARDFDNLLRVSNQNLSNTIELLVLSACKTAQGDKRAALGLAGIAVRAGARSTLATLWSVDDESTTKLMSRFYGELKTGVNKSAALQRAQLAVFANEKRPYFWASYVLVGNWL